jgi:hypothetical protein
MQSNLEATTNNSVGTGLNVQETHNAVENPQYLWRD